MVDAIVSIVMIGLGIVMPGTGQVMGENTDEQVVEAKMRREYTEEERRKMKQEAEVRAKNLRTLQKAKADQFESTLKEKRLEAVEKLSQERKAFQEKLATIKDARKRTTLANINTRLTELNTKQTTLMSEHLETMSSLVERIMNKSSELKAEGIDTTAVESAVTTAQVAITTAQTAVAAQAAKTYTVTISGEDNLKGDVSVVMRQLQADLKATRDTVGSARKAVADAIAQLKVGRLMNEEGEE